MKVNLKGWKFWLGVVIAIPLLPLLAINVGLVQMLPPAAARPLEEATQVSLYSLDDWHPRFSPDEKPDGSLFHGHPVLGVTELKGQEAQTAIGAFQKAVAFWMPVSFQCFEPHHALRIVSGGHTFDYLLCYRCDAIAVYEDDKQITYQNASGSPDALNRLLTAAHIPLWSRSKAAPATPAPR